ncbi:acetylornithine deacetylase [Swaminathania salitolerans]|uniref:Acetylornithine deacetylase n=1 Tax=Swaminathania salitolerans TaxID=182838 RepID=A0A511BUR4_9PROT|nr:acetylornithine deacetylase [Swaminathania salitolerans]GBQ13872.1 acetylornithine deacetylase [Swaminathania salitolerans LMG 21291]GEL01708.1 acetylornithine deacetylase [Swaminathania salitolerans]
MTPPPLPGMDVCAILAKLVSFDTTSCNPNAALMSWVEDYLTRMDVPFWRSVGPEPGKWNLHAILGPVAPGGLAFSGHVDCVPVEGQDWSADPFVLREESGRLVGRGAADMKGFVAVMLVAIPRIRAEALLRPVHLFLTFDEEITCDGARHLVADVQQRGLMPDFCVIGEPTLLAPVIAHKGRYTVRVDITGRPAHSSRPALGTNALHAMGKAIAIIAEIAESFPQDGLHVPGFDPDHTTMQVGLAQGGSILNIVPEKSSFEMEWRAVPGESNEEIYARILNALAPLHDALRADGPGCGLVFTPLVDLPPLALSPDAPLASLLQQVTGHNSAGYVSYGTEAGIYQQAGLPTIVCGPGSIEQAHRPDEWISRDQIARCETMIDALVRRVCLSA